MSFHCKYLLLVLVVTKCSLQVMIFFSAHGVPLAYVEEAGDPYKAEMEECVDLIMEELEKRKITNAYTLAYQVATIFVLKRIVTLCFWFQRNNTWCWFIKKLSKYCGLSKHKVKRYRENSTISPKVNIPVKDGNFPAQESQMSRLLSEISFQLVYNIKNKPASIVLTEVTIGISQSTRQ